MNNEIVQDKSDKLPLEENDSLLKNFIISGSDNDMIGSEKVPRKIDFYGICICLDGNAEITIGMKKYHIKKGDLCSIFPCDILHIRKKSSDFNGYIVYAHPEFVEGTNISSATSIYLYVKDNRCISLSEIEQRDLIKMHEFIKVFDARVGHPYRKEIAEHLATAIIYEVIGFYKRVKVLDALPFLKKDQLYFDFVELINNHCKRQRGIEFYADKLCISSRYLSTICKEIAGQTAKECIDEQITIKIQTTLISTTLSIAEISDEFNFPNASFFTKYFKGHNKGITPKQYRHLENS